MTRGNVKGARGNAKGKELQSRQEEVLGDQKEGGGKGKELKGADRKRCWSRCWRIGEGQTAGGAGEADKRWCRRSKPDSAV